MARWLQASAKPGGRDEAVGQFDRRLEAMIADEEANLVERLVILGRVGPDQYRPKSASAIVRTTGSSSCSALPKAALLSAKVPMIPRARTAPRRAAQLPR